MYNRVGTSSYINLLDLQHNQLVHVTHRLYMCSYNLVCMCMDMNHMMNNLLMYVHLINGHVHHTHVTAIDCIKVGGECERAPNNFIPSKTKHENIFPLSTYVYI